jgi:hypothetical protein
MRSQAIAFVALVTLIVTAAPTVSASAAPVTLRLAHRFAVAASPDPSVTIVDGTVVTTTVPVTTPAQLAAFEASDTPKVITIDPATNQVTRVSQKLNAASPKAISNPCDAGSLCWESAKIPYANYGFSGAGTYRGTWHWRGTMNSNNWGGLLQYYLKSVGGVLNSTPAFGHNSTIKFGGGIQIIGVLVAVDP